MPSKWKRDAMKRDYEDHKKRVREAKSLLDLEPPRPMPMSQRREIERRRKQAVIEMDNRLLLDRLAVAMDTKNIDNVLVKKPFISMNELQRRKILTKLTMENNRLLDRIQHTVPSYDSTQWKIDEEHHLEVLRNMTEFPDLFQPPGARKSLLNPWTNKNYGKDNFVEPEPSPSKQQKSSSGSRLDTKEISGELHRGGNSSAFSLSGSFSDNGHQRHPKRERKERVRNSGNAIIKTDPISLGEKGTHSMQSSPSLPNRQSTNFATSGGAKRGMVSGQDEDQYLELLDSFASAVALQEKELARQQR